MSALAADSRMTGRGIVVALTGDLDLATIDSADAALRRAIRRAKLVVIDLRGLDFIGVVGLRLLMAAAARARLDGRRLVVVRGTAAVQRAFELTGVDELLEIVEHPEAALDAPPARAGGRST